MWVYISHSFILYLTHRAKVWWGIWVFGLHEKITSLEPWTTCHPPYLLLIMENLFDDVVVDMSEKLWFISMRGGRPCGNSKVNKS